MVIKKGKTETEKTIEEIKFPKWLDDLITKKWFLYLSVAVVLVMVIGFSLPASTRDNLANAIFAKTATDVSATGEPPNGGAGNPPVVGTATPTPNGQEKNQIDTDRNDPILAQRIKNLEMGGKTLMPINNLPQEIQIGASSVYITGLTVNNGVTGFIENRGKKALYVDIGRFNFITKDYIFATDMGVIYIDGQYDAPAPRYFKPSQKKSFSTINTKDTDGFKKLGGLPEDLKQFERLLAQSSYLIYE